MTTQVQETAVTTQTVVDAPIDHAFRVFTEGIGSWWDPDHHILEAELAEMVFEPRVGGHIIDRGTDGGGYPLGPGARVRPAEPGLLQLGHQPALAAGDRSGEDQRD